MSVGPVNSVLAAAIKRANCRPAQRTLATQAAESAFRPIGAKFPCTVRFGEGIAPIRLTLGVTGFRIGGDVSVPRAPIFFGENAMSNTYGGSMVYGKIIYAPRMEDINNYANRLWIRVTDEARLRLDASDSIMASGKSVFPLLLSFLETRNLALQCKVEVAELGRKVIVVEPAGEAYSDGVALRLTDEVAENAGPSNDEVRAQIWEYVMGKSRTKPPVLIADVNAAGNALIFKAGSTVKTKQPTELWLKVAPAGALGRVSVIRFIEPGHFISVTYGMTEGSCKRIDSKQGRGSKGSWEMSRHVKERL